MPHESDESEVDEFAAERAQRGMYDDSETDAPSEAFDSQDDDSESGSEAESSAMAARRFQGWEPDEIDGEEEEFTDVSEDEGSDEDEDGEEDVPRRGKSDQERLASLRKSMSLPGLLDVVLISG
jgi:hypothetical protein